MPGVQGDFLTLLGIVCPHVALESMVQRLVWLPLIGFVLGFTVCCQSVSCVRCHTSTNLHKLAALLFGPPMIQDNVFLDEHPINLQKLG